VTASQQDEQTASLAARKRQLVRDELSAAAVKLLAHQGFEDTTIDQITAAAGVSRRTFFRYFKSKEDVVIEFLGGVGARVRAELAVRPRDETPGVALRHALSVFVDTCCEHPAKSLPLIRLTLSTPALRARYLDRRHQWQAEFAAELARRAGLDADEDMRPALTAAIALTAFDTALAQWVRHDGNDDLHDLVDQAFALVAVSLTADYVV
jgi:AcrR family transcriptional regulator